MLVSEHVRLHVTCVCVSLPDGVPKYRDKDAEILPRATQAPHTESDPPAQLPQGQTEQNSQPAPQKLVYP